MRLGIIGGSGLYDMPGLMDAQWVDVETSWGAPSDQIRTGVLNDIPVAFLPRHGRGHVHTPTSVPYRANIAALKQLGVTDIVALSACGSFREGMAPGDFVVVDLFIDRTVGREASFFGPGLVAHVSLAHPTCPRLGTLALTAGQEAAITMHSAGTYLAMEGPQFSTLAESRLFRDVWGADVIGMTNMPEARLAREAEICYAPIAMVTDFDSWHPDHGAVDVAQVVEVMQSNVAKARDLIDGLTQAMTTDRPPCPEGCDRALEYAIITAADARDPGMVAKLMPIAGRILTES